MPTFASAPDIRGFSPPPTPDRGCQGRRAQAGGRGSRPAARLRAEADRKALRSQLGALDNALIRNGQAVTALGQEIETFLRAMRDQTADLARRGIEAAELRYAREEAAVWPSFNLSPYL